MEQKLAEQKEYFLSGITRPVSYRKAMLKILYRMISENRRSIESALHSDLKKSAFEAFTTEIGFTLEEISLHLKKLRKWAKNKRVRTNQKINFWSKSRIVPEPYGQVLIISPWNYPFQLCMAPLIGAISAGNVAVLKPSEYTPNTSQLIEKLVADYFPPEYLQVYNGGVETSQRLLKNKWDYIFFTGSPAVGKIIMEAASINLTPITLELGGKSPAIVDESADIRKAAKRIAWGKGINAGQTCVAPDYALVHESVVEEFKEELRYWFIELYGENPAENPDYPSIINKEKTKRLADMLKDADIYHGGKYHIESCFVAPTIITDLPGGHVLASEEIFGPLLPVKAYRSLTDVMEYLQERPKPLALYLFSRNKRNIQRTTKDTSSGGMAVNDTIMHITNPRLPFGGVGGSGMGQYHGKHSFDTFTHYKSRLHKKNFTDPSIRYPPFTKTKYKLASRLMK